jgi:hypothetical protein
MQNANQVLTTPAEVVNHLVTYCGIKQNWAQASVTENFTFDDATKLQRYEKDYEFNGGHYTVVDPNGMITVIITGQQALHWYCSWLDYGITETPEGITFDNELVYDLNGNYK